jgi:2-hydroxychromene-2-carboxylate isomerase
MSKTVDYYFSPISPWTYLGHARFADMAKRHGAMVNVKPADFGKVFAASGGLPLAKRAPQRQAYRMVELKRFRDYLKTPLNLQPKFFPAPSDLAAQFIIAAGRAGGGDAACRRRAARLLGGGAQHRRWRNLERDLQRTGHERRAIGRCGTVGRGEGRV